jgi:hypothetical protein
MRPGVVLLALLALAFPVGLVFAVYVTAEPSLAAQPVPAAITERVIAEPSKTTTEDDRTTTDRRGSDRCQEAEHRDDPECLSGRSGSGSSGSGSSSDDDNSGSGSSNSGSGSSNSGSGSSNSGSGGGDD